MKPPSGATAHSCLQIDRRSPSDEAQLRIEWLTSADRPQLDCWDEFLLNSPRGHYCQLSTWLRSFEAYGFEFSVLTARATPSGSIVGGIGLLQFGRPLLGLMSAPIGPIVGTGYESLGATLLEETLRRARDFGVFMVQLQLPCSSQTTIPALIGSLETPDGAGSQPGLPFATGTAPNQMLWIEFPETSPSDSWDEQLIRRFSATTRRNIRLSQRQALEACEITGEQGLREAYSLIEMNGVQQGYATRGWHEFGPTLVEQVSKRQAIVLVARHRGKAVGAHYAVLAGRRYSYLMGGTVRDTGNLKVGHFLHWTAMRKARALALLGYDLTSGGTAGVMRFKMGFRPQHIPFVSPRYYVLSRWRFELFARLYPWLRAHKRLVSRALSVMHQVARGG
jgi:hypothetical protein